MVRSGPDCPTPPLRLPCQETDEALEPAQIVRHVAEFPQQLRVAEFADHGIAGTAERDGADAAGGPRQDLGAPQCGCRALAFLGGARARGASVVLQEWQCYVVRDIGHLYLSRFDRSGGTTACAERMGRHATGRDRRL